MNPHLSTPTGGQDDFGIVLGLAYQRFVDDLRGHMHTQEFTDMGPSFGYVLRSVAAAPLTLTELAAGLRLTPQGAAKIVHEMIAQRYLKQQVDSADARARRLYLAARGERALRTARRFHAEFEQRFAQQHGAKQAKALRSALEALISEDPETLNRTSYVLRPL